MMLENTRVQGLVAQAFASHSLCGCADIGHALAGAAHVIIEAETEDLYHGLLGHQCTRVQRADKVWNSKGEANERRVHSALWRALWAAKETGQLRLVPAAAHDEGKTDTCPVCACTGQMRDAADGQHLVCLCCGRLFTPGQVEAVQ